MFSGMLSATIGSSEADLRKFCSRIGLFKKAASLGGVESLVSWPVVLSHASLSDAERQTMGIQRNLLRFSVGLEDIEDLLEDVDQALAGI